MSCLEAQRCPGQEAGWDIKATDSTFPSSPGLYPLVLGITMHHLILSLWITSGRMGRGTWTRFFLGWGVIRLGSPTGHTEPAAEDREAPCLPPLPAVYVSLIFFPHDMVGRGWFPQGSYCHPASSIMQRAVPGHETPHNHVSTANTCARNGQAAYVVTSALMFQV